MIPDTLVSASPLRLSISGFNTGIPAATAASKYKHALLSIAMDTSSSPQSAIISLLAVITDFPLPVSYTHLTLPTKA